MLIWIVTIWRDSLDMSGQTPDTDSYWSSEIDANRRREILLEQGGSRVTVDATELDKHYLLSPDYYG
jgi:hypothetical protein